MVQDVVRSLGFLCLGTRFKRLGERVQAEAQRTLDALEPPLQAGQHPVLAALDLLGPLTVGELAEAVGISQPGVTRSLAILADQGLVASTQDDADQRRRHVALTDAGRRFVEGAKREAWPRVEAAVAALCADLSGPLLAQLDALEDRLAAAPRERRTGRRGRAAA
jgi:DNA-binding MarR family transcriptional regulator